MNSMQAIFFWGALVALGLIALFLIIYVVGLQKSGHTKGTGGSLKSIEQILLGMMVLVVTLLTGVIAARWIETGHGPFSSMFEFSIAFAWGIVILGILYWFRYRIMLVSGASSVIALALLVYASQLSSQAAELVPALQQSFLLSTHVAAAAISYGAFAIGFIAAILILWQRRKTISWLPSPETLDRISYHTVIIGFPLLTLVIILGAIWAEQSWGRYWSWDPKESAALVTWLFYAGYLHTRILKGWQGTRSAVLLVIAFTAVIFTFFGNYIFQGLHAYS
ncbi:cytochrome c-type biogenesis protein CcsA/ResC [Dehalogenimonas sp. WBC-2]|nr:cytochrome c-type biogenesis protein CcsA/ResC [Dehalogenimonas sp. WBC-2]